MSPIPGLGSPLPQHAPGDSFPFVARDAVVRGLALSLARVTRNNPLLIGEPGVGKSALVQGLSYAIGAKAVPPALLGARIVPLDLSALMAGTKHRGDLEKRISELVAHLQAHPDLILFIDEIHALMGGGAQGQLSLADALKPSLGDGSVRIIGATTIAEYRRHIECDGAFARRFRTVLVEPPTGEELQHIMLSIRDYLEQAHGVAIADDAVRAAIRYSDHYLGERQQPDKSIDVLDEACVRFLSHASDTNQAFADARYRVHALVDERAACVAAGRLDRVAEIDYQDLVAARDAQRAARTGPAVDDATVAGVIGDWARIPIDVVRRTGRERVQGLAATLSAWVSGQELAVDLVARTLAMKQLGIGRPNGPLASFLLSGPTGVGKTSLALALAEGYFGSSHHLLRFDMSEYREPHSTAKLIGSPPGYVGFEDRGQLTEALRSRPFGVVLFDEADKAHPTIWNLLLQLLEDGRITDSHGRPARAHGHVIVLTTNLDESAICDFFRPEVLARLDGRCALGYPDQSTLVDIAAFALRRLAERCAAAGFQVVGDGAEALAETLIPELVRAAPGGIVSPRSVVRAIDDRLGSAIAAWFVAHPPEDQFVLNVASIERLVLR